MQDVLRHAQSEYAAAGDDETAPDQRARAMLVGETAGRNKGQRETQIERRKGQRRIAERPDRRSSVRGDYRAAEFGGSDSDATGGSQVTDRI